MPQAVETSAVHPPVAAAHRGVPAPELGCGDLKMGGAGDGGYPTFADLLDIINPLQHIPFVNTIYRRLTGDTINPAMQLIGGTLFGGPVGAVIAFGNLALAHISGRDLGEHFVALAESAAGGVTDAVTRAANACGNGYLSAAFAPPGETGETPGPARQALALADRLEQAAAGSPAAQPSEPGGVIDPQAQQAALMAERPSVRTAATAAPAIPPDAPDVAAPLAQGALPGGSSVRFGADALLAFRSDLATVARTAASGSSLPASALSVHERVPADLTARTPRPAPPRPARMAP